MKKLTAVLTAVFYWTWMVAPPMQAQMLQAIVVQQAAAPTQGVVQYVSGNRSATASSYTLPVTSTGSGHAFYVFATDAAGTQITISETGASDTFTYILQGTTACYNQNFSGTYNCAVAYVCSGSSGVTGITASSSNQFSVIQIQFFEMSGIASSSCLDAGSNTVMNRPSGSTSWSSASMTAASGDLLVGMASCNSNSTMAATGSWMNANTAPGGASAYLYDSMRTFMFEYQSNVSAGSYTATGTVSNSTACNMLLVGFKHS